MTEHEIRHKIDKEIKPLTDLKEKKKAIRRFVGGLSEMDVAGYITFSEYCRLMAYLFDQID